MFEEILQLNTNFIFLVRKIAKKHTLTLPQALILLNVSIKGSSMTELANLLGLDPSTVTRNVEKLEMRNLLYREKSTQDTRIIYVYRSNQGKTVAEKIEEEVEFVFKKVLDVKSDIKNGIQKINWSLEKNKL